LYTVTAHRLNAVQFDVLKAVHGREVLPCPPKYAQA
jgi:hypothetical protein